MICTEIIRDLCKKKGTTIAQLEKDLGFGNGTIASSKSNYIRSDRLKAIADYFDVSMEYLLTGKELEPFWDGQSDAPAFTIEELQLLDLFRTLPDAKRSEVIQYCKFLASEAKREKKKDTASSKEA
jgi:transcriptional regulator with XRE-family HTH domain